MPEKIEILIEGKDGLTHPATSAARSLSGLSSAASNTGRSLGGLGSIIGGIASQAAGFATAIVGLQALGGLSGMIQSTVGGMIGMNAEMETMQQSFKILLSDAAAAGGGVQQVQEDISAATRSAAATMVNAQERMADSAEDHQRAVAKLAQEFGELESDSTKALGKMASEYQAAMAQMAASHAETIVSIRQQIAEYSRDFSRQSEDRQRQFDDEIARRRQRLAEEVADIRRRATEAAQTAPERFLREREASKRNAEFLKQSIAEEMAKGTGADKALLASLRQRLSQEEQLQKRTFLQFQSKEKAQVETAIQEANARAAAEESIMRERFERERQMAAVVNSERIAGLQARMAKEDAEYVEALAKQKTKYAEDLATYKASEAEKLQALRDRQDEETRQYARTVRDTQQALAQAGASYAEATKKATQQSAGMVNQVAQMYENLAKFVDRPLATAEDRAAAMVEYIEAQIDKMPSLGDKLAEGAQRLVASRLDVTQYLGTVADLAAGANRPLTAAAEAFATLATADVGEAVIRFKDLMMNIRTIPGLFNGDQLAVPLEEALVIVQKAVDEKFGGMAAAQAGTWDGMVMAMGVAWKRFLRTIGKPLFPELKAGVADILAFLKTNDSMLKEFGTTLGKSLSDGLKQLGPMAQQAMTGLLEWIQSGKAEKDIRTFLSTIKDVTSALIGIGRFVGDLAGIVIGVISWIKQTEWLRTALGVLYLAVAAIAIFVGGPFTIAIGAFVLAWVLAGDKIQAVLGTVRDFMGNAVIAMGQMWSSLITTIRTNLDTFVASAKSSINDVITMINAMLVAWNALAFDLPYIEIPSWVPGIGGQSWGGGRIETPDIPLIPLLDEGAIVKKATLAMLAGNNRPEAVVPLDRAGGFGGTFIYNQNAPVYGFANFEDALVNAYERASRRGRI